MRRLLQGHHGAALHGRMDRRRQNRARRTGRARRRVLAHVPAKWIPVRQQEHAPCKNTGACPDSIRMGHALMSKSARQTPGSSNDRVATIYRALRHAIIEQALSPGAKLPEDAIGERFGASRTIVRHVLGQLAAEGLVELRRNHGASVAIPSWQEARDVFDVRIGLERLIVSRLAGQLTPEQIKRLDAHVDDEEHARGTDEPLSIRLATEFHIVLAEMTGCPVLTRYVSEVASRCG